MVKVLETPAVNVLLAGVEKHPDASLGDLMNLMSSFNLRFGAAETPRQKEVYKQLYPLLVNVPTEVISAGSTPATSPSDLEHGAPLAAFDKMSYDQIDGKPSPAPKK